MNERAYTRRLLIAAGVLVLVVVLVVVVGKAAAVLLVLFAGVLLAVLLDGLARLLRRVVPLPRGAALALVVVALFGALAAFVALTGPQLARQADEMGQRLPAAVERLQGRLEQYEWGRYLLSESAAGPGNAAAAGGGRGRLTSLLSGIVGGVTDLLVVAFLGIYLAADPRLYYENALRLLPKPGRQRAREALSAVGHALRHWLAGQFASMAIVGTLATTGLVLLGVPLALLLGVVAGLLNFVPYVGPLLSFFPAVLVAMGEGTDKAVYVAALFLGVQFLESYVITPLIQKRAVSLPPALLLTSEVVAAVLFGTVGLVMAAPLAVTLIVLVQVLYVRGVLGDDVPTLGT